MWCIYRITNCINGKTYIGQHKYKKTPYDRKYMGSGVDLVPDQKKYGMENFIKGIIVDGIEDQETTNQLEEYYIALERAMVGKENCYNKADGGQAGCLNYWEGKHRSEETKKKLSEASKDKWRDEEYRRKCVESHKGKPTWNKGLTGCQTHTEETKRKIAENNKGKHNHKGSNNPMYGKHWKLVDGKRIYY